MRSKKMGIAVGEFRVPRLTNAALRAPVTTACRAGMALAVLLLCRPAQADGDASRPLAPPPVSRVVSTGSVVVDMSALDSVPNRRLLLPAAGGSFTSDGPVRLRPPPGVKPFVPAPIRLRPPPGVRTATRAPVTRTVEAEKPETPKAEAPKPETKVAAATPASKPEAPKAEAPKPAAPAAKAPPAKAPAAAPAKAAATPPPPPPQKQTQVAVAQPAAPAPGQPRSLLTPPPAAAPAPAKTETAKTEAPKAEEKTAEAKPAEPAQETTVAALPPPAKTPVDNGPLTIFFKVGVAELPSDATSGLKALAARLVKDPSARIELVGYASDPEKSISRSRRLSLERVVNVRKLLIASGVESTRIGIRALGEQSGNGPPDRVDAVTAAKR